MNITLRCKEKWENRFGSFCNKFSQESPPIFFSFCHFLGILLNRNLTTKKVLKPIWKCNEKLCISKQLTWQIEVHWSHNCRWLVHSLTSRRASSRVQYISAPVSLWWGKMEAKVKCDRVHGSKHNGKVLNDFFTLAQPASKLFKCTFFNKITA